MTPEVDQLRTQWQKLDESDRRRILKKVNKEDPEAITRVTKEMRGGFGRAKVLAREGAVARLVDGALFRGRGNSPIERILLTYFTRVDPELNEEFVQRYDEIAKNDPSLTCEQVTCQVIEEQKSQSRPLIGLFEAALRVVTPLRYSEELAVAIVSAVPRQSSLAPARPNDEEMVPIMPPPAAKPQPDRVAEQPEPVDSLPAKTHEVNPVEQDTSDNHTGSLLSPRQAASALVNSVLDAQLLPALDAIHEMEEEFARGAKVRAAWEDINRELPGTLLKLQERGLVVQHETLEALLGHARTLSIREAVEYFRDRADLASEITGLASKASSQAAAIGHKRDWAGLVGGSADLDVILRKVKAQAALTAEAFVRVNENHQLVLQLRDDLLACNHSAARDLIEQVSAQQWLATVLSALQIKAMQPGSGQPDFWSGARDFASKIVCDQILPLVASLMTRAEAGSPAALIEEVRSLARDDSWDYILAYLRGLTWEQLFQLANKFDWLADPIAELTIIESARRGDAQFAAWLNTMLACRNVRPSMRLLLQELAAIEPETALSALLSGLKGRDSDDPESALRDATESLVAHFGKSGWDGIFKKLRQMVQDEHLAPIVEQLLAGNHEVAIRTWRSAGDSEAIVHDCASRVQSTRRPSKQHLDKVTQYLNEFNDLMEELERALRELTPGRRSLSEALSRYLDDADRSSSGRKKLLEISFGTESSVSAHHQCDPQILGPMLDQDSVDLCVLRPCEVESLIVAVNSKNGRVPVSCLLAERLMNLIHKERASRPNVDSMALLAGRLEWAAARHLASIDPSLQPMLAKLLAPIQAALRAQYAEVLNASKLCENKSSELVDITCLMEAAIENGDVGSAEEYAAFLSEEIQRLRQIASPEYGLLRDFLIEADCRPGDDVSLECLREKVAALRAEHVARRRHVVYLNTALTQWDYHEQFSAPISEIVSAIDRPRFWATPATAKRVEESLKHLVNYVRNKARLMALHPEEYAQLCHMMARYIATCLHEPLDSEAGRTSVEKLDLLAIEIAVEDSELREVVDKLSAMLHEDPEAETARTVPAYVHAIERASTYLQPIQPIRTRTRHSPDGVIEDIRGSIRSVAAEYGDSGTPAVGHRLAAEMRRVGDWSSSSRLMAKLAVEAGLEDSWPQAITAAACRDRLEALLRDTAPFDRRRARDLVLGLGSVVAGPKRGQMGAFITMEEAEDCLVRAIGAGIRSSLNHDDSLEDRRRTLEIGLTELRDVPTTDERFRWLFDLLTRGNALIHPDTGTSVSSAIANRIWDEFAGYGDAARARTTLLRLGFNMRMEDEFLLQLANAQLGQSGIHVPEYLKAVRNAETNPNASHEAYRLRQIILENLPPNKHRPWRHLIDETGSFQGAQEEGDLCRVSLESRQQDSSGMLVLDLCLAPLRRAIISSAVIVMKLQAPRVERESKPIRLLLEDESIAQEKIFRVPTPFAASELAGESVVISYILNVENLMGNAQTLRAQWSIDQAALSPNPFSSEMLKRNWPGAYGNPVGSRAFHGRVKEIERLRDCLSGADGRQRSAVIVGQRRIGKTSLLLEAGKQYPPQEGHVCAIFSNIASMDANAARKSLKESVFDCLTEVGGEKNASLRGLLEDKVGAHWSRRLRRGLANSISLSSALDEFVKGISHHTAGRIARVAFFVDEMQAIFKYDRQDVDSVMWALRELVQQSPTISLVLAGSGITRELTRNYNAALFGSIESIHLRPFTFPEEQDAVADTLIPKEARSQLCPDSESLDRLVCHAHLLTGGHPYFLAMLGSAAATVLEGRPLSIPLLNDVARGMMQGDGDGGSTGGAEKFYGHLLDSLDVTGRGRYCAQLVLVNIAKQVTMEWPWLRSQEAMHGPAIGRAELSPRECVDALKLLQHEDIIEFRHEHGEPQYRIKVPLVAQALRYHSNDLEHSAHLELTAASRGG